MDWEPESAIPDQILNAGAGKKRKNRCRPGDANPPFQGAIHLLTQRCRRQATQAQVWPKPCRMVLNMTRTSFPLC